MSRVMEKVRTEVPEYLRAEKKLSSTEQDVLADEKLSSTEQDMLANKKLPDSEKNILPDEKNQQDSETEYLSDADLEALIMQIEQQELVMAPPDLKARILREVQEGVDAQTEMEVQVPEEKHALKYEQTKEKMKSLYLQKRKSKATEFRRYCFRVWTSVAAAILLLFMLPMISGQNADSGRWGGDGDYTRKGLSQNRIEDIVENNNFDGDRLTDSEEKYGTFASRKDGSVSAYGNGRAADSSESILQRIFCGSNIFGGEDRFNIFR